MKLLRNSILALSCLYPLATFAQEVSTATVDLTASASQSPNSDSADYQRTINRAVAYLKYKAQAPDGSFSKQAGVGPTALVITGLLEVGLPPSDASVAKSLKWLQQYVKPDGGIYMPESKHRNYDTCIAMVAFQKANRNGEYDKIISRAEKFVKGLQWDESEGKNPNDTEYGGAGYGSHQRPDLSNTTFLVDALRELGAGEDDPAIQKALTFVSRCQNLESPANQTPHAAKINDGGFYYTVANGGETKAGETVNGGLRSYGSMTYAGLKSMIYAGLDQDDKRVKAAVEFLKSHYSITENPGLGKQGLFYYYQTMAKALEALGQDEFVDQDGKSHDWRQELRQHLASLQAKDGSWVNETTRWMEGDPNLVSAYALLALAHCKPGK